MLSGISIVTAGLEVEDLERGWDMLLLMQKDLEWAQKIRAKHYSVENSALCPVTLQHIYKNLRLT